MERLAPRRRAEDRDERAARTHSDDGGPARSRRWRASGHELPVYPSYYPHEIEIATLAPERAAELMRAGKLHAYVGGARRLPPRRRRHRCRGVARGLRRRPAQPGLAARQGRGLGLRRRRGASCATWRARRRRAHRPSLSGDALARRLSPSTPIAPRPRGSGLLRGDAAAAAARPQGARRRRAGAEPRSPRLAEPTARPGMPPSRR